MFALIVANGCAPVAPTDMVRVEVRHAEARASCPSDPALDLVVVNDFTLKGASTSIDRCGGPLEEPFVAEIEMAAGEKIAVSVADTTRMYDNGVFERVFECEGEYDGAATTVECDDTQGRIAFDAAVGE